MAEDPTLRLENNAETRQLVLWCMGEAHADVLLERLSKRHSVEVEKVDCGCRSGRRSAAAARRMGRNVKQTGGHGQFAVCDLEIEPLPSGGGFEFVDKIVGGAVPRQFIPSVEKGVRTQMQRGVLAGYPDGGRPGDAVRRQGPLGRLLRHGLPDRRGAGAQGGGGQGPMLLLEPVDEVSVLVADDYVGSVMCDLSSPRAGSLGTEPVGIGRTLVRAEVPELEITATPST